MTKKIGITSISEAIVEIKKLQAICKSYREENQKLKAIIDEFKSHSKAGSDEFINNFFKGFGK